jgi:hypothetical protein
MTTPNGAAVMQTPSWTGQRRPSQLSLVSKGRIGKNLTVLSHERASKKRVRIDGKPKPVILPPSNDLTDVSTARLKFDNVGSKQPVARPPQYTSLFNH